MAGLTSKSALVVIYTIGPEGLPAPAAGIGTGAESRHLKLDRDE